MDYFLGIDVGTTGAKAVLINQEGRVVSSASVEYPLYNPYPGWSEQNPEDWWQATVSAIREVIAQAGIRPSLVAGVGLSGQMHGSVFLGPHNEVIRPAILWNDQRTTQQCEWITQQVGAEKVRQITANPVLTGFTAPKIIWLRENEPHHYAQVHKVLLPKDYIRFRLTGVYATDVADASGTSLLNVPQRQWSEEILQALDIPRSWLPEVYESPQVTGHIHQEASGETGLPVGTPVVAGAGDQAAGAVGTGIVEPGIVSSTVGTSGVVFAFSDQPRVDPQGRVHTFCHAVPGKWHVMGVMLSAGGSLRWLRDLLDTGDYHHLTQEAGKIPAGCEGLIFLPYLTGERTPHADPHARGVFFGLSLRHTRAHLVRAVLEGVAYGLRDSFEILEEMGVPMEQVRASGGGARSPLWLQIQANVMHKPHALLNIDEGPAFGVALLAGVGTGRWSSVEEACRKTIEVEKVIEPQGGITERYTDFYRIYKSLYPALKELFAKNAQVIEKYLD